MAMYTPTTSDRLYRLHQKALAEQRRGGPGHCMCDLCGKNPGVEYHEIINRGRTVKNEAARLFSYSQHICALLCRDCHTGSQNVHNPQSAQILLNRLIELYGYEAVKADWERASNALLHPVTIPFPEKKDISNDITTNPA